jgi:hypothetical protein
MLDLSHGQQDAGAPTTSVWQRCRDLIGQHSRLDPTYCPNDEIERMASDLRMPATELLSASRRGPNSAELLRRRLATLDLDPGEIGRIEPGAMRDLQRCCTLCGSRGRCARDLARNASSPAWKSYCPNAGTLAALDAMPWASRREW